MTRLMGVYMLIPMTVMLTISFFVLFSVRKADVKGLKTFGMVIAALLWVCALVFLATGFWTLSTGKPPMVCQMMMGGKTHPGMMSSEITADTTGRRYQGTTTLRSQRPNVSGTKTRPRLPSMTGQTQPQQPQLPQLPSSEPVKQ